MTRPRAFRGAVLGLVVLAAVAGCSPGGGAFRDTGAAISSTTRFDMARFAGDWTVTHRFGPGGAERFAIAADGTVRRAGGACGTCTQRLDVTGPGRFTLGGAEHWVLWVDADYRTAAIGTPSGAFGWIMERGAAVTPPDRLAAARDILGWAGYDLARLVAVSG